MSNKQQNWGVVLYRARCGLTGIKIWEVSDSNKEAEGQLHEWCNLLEYKPIHGKYDNQQKRQGITKKGEDIVFSRLQLSSKTIR